MRGRAADTVRISVDLPTFGIADQADVGDQVQLETQPPLLARRARLRVARRLVGRRREVHVAAAAAPAVRDDDALVRRRAGRRSARRVSASRTMVPGGTRTTRSAPRLPYCSLPRPCSPRPALSSGWYLKSSSVVRPGSTAKTTSPPSPPSPPLGPPCGLYFSRRKLTQPRPPSPARTCDLGLVDELHCSSLAVSGPWSAG